MEILINDYGDYNIVISLTGNTVLGGTYINSENLTLSKLDSLVDSTFIKQDKTKLVSEKIGVNAVFNGTNTKQIINEIFDTNTSTGLTKYFEDNSYFVTGTTTSKIDTIKKSFINKPVVSYIDNTIGVYGTKEIDVIQKINKNISVISGRNTNLLNKDNKQNIPIYSNTSIINQKILIHGTDIFGMILKNNRISEYILYVGTDYPIKYIDFPDGTTIFKYKRSPDGISNESNYLLYNNLVDEPKILSEVFIDRGVNNVFDPIKKLKNINNLNELIKSGLGFYKINTTGVNFKNI